MIKIFEKKINLKEVTLFLINGIITTSLHFFILHVFIIYNVFNYVTFAFFFAAIISITISFLGNKYLVFKKKKKIITDMLRFLILYIFLLLLNSLLIYILCDMMYVDYKLGFIIALFIQTFSSYFGLKFFVFVK